MKRFNRTATIAEATNALLTIKRDDEGRILIGNPTLGCPHCGTVLIKHSPGPPETILHHPGVECCPERLEEEIAWREEEKAGIKKRIAEDDRHIRAMRDEIEISRPQDRGRLERKVERSLDVQDRKNATYSEELAEIDSEIYRLRVKLKGARKA